MCGSRPPSSGLATSTVRLRSPPELLDRAFGILERLAVLAGLVLDRLDALALLRAGDDHRRLAGRLARLGVGRVDRGVVVAVDRDRVPAERLGPLDVDVEVPADHRLARLPEAVDVDDRRQVVEAVEGGVLERLPHRALGHLRVTAQAPHAVGQPVELLARGRHADRDRQALAERARGHVDPRDDRDRVALELRAELAEREQLLVRDRPGRLEHRVVQRRRVALGEDQVVVVGVVRVRVVELQVLLHQDRHQVGRRHRGRRVAGVGGRGGADRVDPQLLAQLAHAATSRSRLLSTSAKRSCERLRELLDALALERLDDVVVVDPGGLEVLEHLARALEVLLDRAGADLAVVVRRLDRVARHRVDRVGPDELLDVEDVAVVGVLGRGRGPQAALRGCALGGQRLPLVAGEDLLVGLVGELGVGDRELALELVVAADLVEALVGLGVDARDEERGDRGDLLGSPPLSTRRWRPRT